MLTRSYSDQKLSEASLHDRVESLSIYHEHISSLRDNQDSLVPESSLFVYKDREQREKLKKLSSEFSSVTQVVLIGIGGSSLGAEAVAALTENSTAELHVLDGLSSLKIEETLQAIEGCHTEEIAICIVSKSGNTAETLVNAGVLLQAFHAVYGESIYSRVICIGNKNNSLLQKGVSHGMHTLEMPEYVGGRYSVFTTVGLAPLLLLGQDIDAFLKGLEDVMTKENEEAVAYDAARLYCYLESGIRSVNVFCFPPSSMKLGFWYRQLAAESLGKEHDKEGHKVSLGFIPSVCTSVELHSIGQLYFSGFSGVYTDFVQIEGSTRDHIIDTAPVGDQYKGKALTEVRDAIYGGVLETYRERELPFRTTTLKEEVLLYDLGLFMGSRMLETMYLAHLMGVDAFTQPNVERYKEITRSILGV